MIITRLSGGLGNQMFQYALGRALSLKHNVPLKLDNYMQKYFNKNNPKILSIVFRDYDLDLFCIQAEIAKRNDIPWWLRTYGFGKFEPFVDGLRRRTINWRGREKSEAQTFDVTMLSVGPSVYLDGYWQSYKYFSNITPVLRQDFQLKQTPSKEIQTLCTEIISKNSLCLHVRRGDYVGNSFHGLKDQVYYDLALEEINKRCTVDKIYVFSDDIEWCRTNLSFKQETLFVGTEYSGNHATGHFHLMRSCKHFIICNSSFSWWAAWLSDNPEKIVVAPKKWFSDDKIDTTDLIPPEWIRV